MYIIGWGVVLALLIVVELMTAQLLTVWFIVGALAALIASLFNVSFGIQLIIFIIVSLLTLLIMLPFIKKIIKTKPIKTNLNMTIGKKAIVTEEINMLIGTGRVNCQGVYWSAELDEHSSDEIIPVDEVVIVKKISGAKLIVNRNQ